MNAELEAERDQDESTFTTILRRLFHTTGSIEATIFVDEEGECIDYCSAVDPFEIKVIGAHLALLAKKLRHGTERLSAGEVQSLEIFADERDYILRLVSDHYAVIVVVFPGCIESELTNALERCVVELRTEAGIRVPHWDPNARLDVQFRASSVWGVAPTSFGHDDGLTLIQDVIGRWEELNDALGNHLVCFRVRTTENLELTLIHDLHLDVWLLADEYQA